METKDKLAQKYENIKNEINMSSVLMRIYADKTSKELVKMKVENQQNSMNFQIEKINPKFGEKSKNYSKMREEFLNSIQNYESVLTRFCADYDEKIENAIFKKVDLETNLLRCIVDADNLLQKDSKKQVSKKVKKIIKSLIKDDKKEQKNEVTESDKYKQIKKKILLLERDIKKVNNKINELNDEKQEKIFEAMERGEKALTTEIRKVRSLGKLTRFFANRFNTYKMIMTKVIEPLNMQIEEFRNENLQQINYTNSEIDLTSIKNQISKIQESIMETKENNKMYEELEK